MNTIGPGCCKLEQPPFQAVSVFRIRFRSMAETTMNEGLISNVKDIDTNESDLEG